MKFLEKWKDKLEFQSFCEGLSKGYRYAFSRLCQYDGKFAVCKTSDAEIGWQYEKRPRREHLFRAWKAGYFYGYTCAYADYNAGDFSVKKFSMPELVNDARLEFDNEKIEWRET